MRLAEESRSGSPDGLPPDAGGAPSLTLLATEPGRAALEFAALPLAAAWLHSAPTGDGHGVLVLPGFLATDASTGVLRRFLRSRGYRVRGWQLGRNVGPTAAALDAIPRALSDLAERTSGPVSIVGWSLGGIYAREVARDRPDLVRQVITLGSPFALTHAFQSRADAAFRRRSHLHADPGRLPTREQMRQPVPVPATAVYSRRDGIVAWQACIDTPGPQRENVEVRCGHLGFGVDPATLWLVADRLAQPVSRWRPFRPPGSLRLLYPGSR